MENIEELLESVTEKLENQFQKTGTVGNMPRVPMMILYAGERAYDSQKDISNTLHQVWRKRADAVSHWKLEEEMDVSKFQQTVDELYNNDSCFRNMNDLFLCFVFDSRDYADIRSFKQAYERVEQIKEYSGQSYCLTMSIVLLDDTAAGSGLSREVKTYLQEKLENKELSYRSTVLLSNRMYGGARLTGSRIRENYNLAGTILLLANSEGADYSAPVAMMFPAENNAYYLTAAYSRVNRPNRKICEFVLHKALSWLEEQLMRGQGLSFDALCARLEIRGGNLQCLTEFFNREVEGNLPNQSALEYLPRATKDTGSLVNRSYRSFDNETMGCADTFYEKEFKPLIEKISKQFSEQFYKHLSKKLSMGEVAATFSDTMIDNVLKQFYNAQLSDEMKVYQYFTERAKTDLTKLVLPMCRLQMQELRKNAVDCVQKLRDLIQEFQDGFFVDAEGQNMKDYYEALTMQFLEKPESEKYVEKFNGTNGDKVQILDLLAEMLDAIITENPIFSAPLIEEMTIRMGEDPLVIQETLQKELMSNIEEKIRLKTITKPMLLQETFVVDQKENDKRNTRFFDYLHQLTKDKSMVTFFDSGYNNSVGVIRLYECNSGSLM